MKPFHTIAVPHRDILTNNLEMAVYAADLWNVSLNKGSEEYKDPKIFFKKTHMTANLRDIINGVEKRLKGRGGGDGYQHIETPFGGGKTHALIAMYHRAREWNAKPVVIVGTTMKGTDTVWGMIEKQLDNKIEKLSGNLAPGREALEEVLEKHRPVLILIDELLQYVVKAAGVEVKDTTLAAQTVAFVQELSEVASTMNQVCVVASFPTSSSEMADQKIANEFLSKISKVSGRKERKITPVDPNDIPNIIRARLFSTSESDIKERAEDIISSFVEYCDRDKMLSGKTISQFRDEFANSYPFLPDVIDVLYQQWGSFPSFQRTRGVLRLLSLVVNSLKDKNQPYITLADFDLANNEIRRELLAHIGGQFDSVISKDITDSDSGAINVNHNMAASYSGLLLGTRAATAIFMCSFSGGVNKGANINEIKRAVAFEEITSSIIDDVVNKLKNKLFYLTNQDERYLFTSEPNLNRLKMDYVENIKENELNDNEIKLLESNIGKQKLRVKIWPESHNDVEDSHQLKLAVIKENDKETCNKILENKGQLPRVYRNTIFFLCPSEGEKRQFMDSLKNMIALEKISKDRSLRLREEQLKDISTEFENEKKALNQLIRKYYRFLYIPTKNGFKELDLGIPTSGEAKKIDDEVYERLLSEEEIHNSIGPLVIKDEYLTDRDFAKTSQMYESMLSTRGSRRPVRKEVVEDSIKRGVLDGRFGLGELIDEKPVCNYFKDTPSISYTENEVIIQKGICAYVSTTPESSHPQPRPPRLEPDGLRQLEFEFNVPEGKMHDVMGILRLVNERFKDVNLKIDAKNGSISDNDIEKIREALRQMGVNYNL